MKKYFLILFFLPLILLSRAIDTFYGIPYYTTTYREEYTRWDHSLGVFAILRTHGASLKEQIAGLLHDVSHTVFSHVGDWIFESQLPAPKRSGLDL